MKQRLENIIDLLYRIVAAKILLLPTSITPVV